MRHSLGVTANWRALGAKLRDACELYPVGDNSHREVFSMEVAGQVWVFRRICLGQDKAPTGRRNPGYWEEPASVFQV